MLQFSKIWRIVFSILRFFKVFKNAIEILDSYIVCSKKQKYGHNKLWLPLTAKFCNCLRRWSKKMSSEFQLIKSYEFCSRRTLLEVRLNVLRRGSRIILVTNQNSYGILLPESATVCCGQRLQHSWVTGELICDPKTATVGCYQRPQGLISYKSRWSQQKHIKVYK